MADREVLINITVIISGLLFASTVVNLIFLKITKKEVFFKVRTIIRSWWMIAVPVLGFGFLGKYGYLVLFSTLILFGLREYLKHSSLRGLRKFLFLFSCLFLAIEVFLLVKGEFELFSIAPSVYLLGTMPFILFFKDTVQDLPKAFASYSLLILLSFSLLHLPAMFLLGDRFFGSISNAIIVFFLLLGLTQLNDVLQFIFGKSFGKNKIVPHLSPNKTEAGFIGAILSISLISYFLFTKLVGLSPTAAILVGLCISVFGIFGDLSFSAIKRYFDTKDFSNALPGHGGLLDRMDSLIFTAPMLFYILKFIQKVNL